MSDQPAKAIVRYAENDFFIGTTASGHSQVLDIDHERNSAATPVELLLIALGGCTGVDIVSVLKKKREKVTDYRVELSGDRRDEHPRNFTKIRMHHIIEGHTVNPVAVARAIELSETKYCSVAATFRPTVTIESTFEIIETSEDES
jgi:putative redox protein